MSETALLEIGVEEFPPSCVEETLAQLKEKAEELFVEFRLDYQKIATYGSSRRLILWVEGLSSRQREKIEKEMGPPKAMVLNEKGELTRSGERYLKAKGARIEDLGVERTKKGEYVYIRRQTPGERTENVLPLIFVQLIGSLRFSKSMRWGREKFYFERPIRYLLAIFGKKVIKFKIAGVTSDRKTVGHRYLSPRPFCIESPQEYLEALRRRWVIVDPEERKRRIVSQMKRITSSLRGKGYRATVLEDEELLKEMIYLAEYPTLFLGRFDRRFLSLPSPILRACLRDYQKHFSVVDGDRPLPYFLGVREGNRKHIKEVVEGNQRVLKARLTDAEFFFEEDKKIPLDQRVPLLKEVVVQKNLGSYYDKTMRLVKLAGKLASCLGEDEKVKRRVERAAYLCKADITTQVVREFPELQGMMGREYALYFGEDSTVAQAIFEHKMPYFNQEEFPKTTEGAILALVDRMDTLVGSFWAGLIPSGSEDPWGLRREAQIVVNIILQRNWKISLDYLIEECLKLYGKKEESGKSKLKDFFRTRLINLLRDKGMKVDQIRAVLKVGFEDLQDVLKRAEALYKASLRENFKEEVIAIIRVMNILKQAVQRKITISEEVQEELLTEKEERDLYFCWKKIEERVNLLLRDQRYLEAYKLITLLQDPIHRFFDKVLVMSEDEKLRANRLSLLNRIRNPLLRIADFTELQVK